MKFIANYCEDIYTDQLYLFKDESIITKVTPGAYVIYFGSFPFGLAIDEKKNCIKEFEGFFGGFSIVQELSIPTNFRKGKIFIDEIISEDMTYPKEYNFVEEGVYCPQTNWFMVGQETSDCEYIQISINTIIALKNNRIMTIYFKALKKD